MNTYPVYDAILARRSIRDFENKPVEREKTLRLLKAAMAAPSACNLQPWTFIAVDDQAQVEKVKSTTDQGQYNAPMLIVVCGISSHIPWQDEGWRQDCGAAAQNMMLEATELGLASVCIGGFDEEKLSALLELPQDVQPMCIVEFGYPTYTREPRTWYTEEAIHWQTFDKTKKRTMRTMQMLQDDIAAGIL